jgi:hypothetical protein
MMRAIRLALAFVLAAGPGSMAADATPKSLFDGGSTAAWRGFRQDTFPAKGWTVEDGALKAQAGEERVDLVTRDTYEDFELELEWRVSPGANSGIFYDVSEDAEAVWHTGPEMQVLDDAGHRDGKNPRTSAGALFALIAAEGKSLKPVGEWNAVRLVKKGRHVEHWLNGRKVVEYELQSPALAGLIAKSKFKELPRFAREGKGHIALQHHGDDVWFRSIRIRAAAPAPRPAQ